GKAYLYCRSCDYVNYLEEGNPAEKTQKKVSTKKAAEAEPGQGQEQLNQAEAILKDEKRD
ncbi:MAG: hypothetical protein ACPLRA_06620, partial [Candidatus Saccharicenans sp.]